MKILEEKIIVFTKEWLGKNYSHCYSENSESYEFEVYLDYQDNHIEQDVIKKLISNLNKATRENIKNALYDYLNDCFIEYRDSEEDYVINQLWDSIKDAEGFEGIEENYDKWDFRDLILGTNLVYAYVDYNEIISNSEIDVDIILETYNSFNHEHSQNCFYEGLNSWNDNIKELIEYGDLQRSDVSLYRLLESQGYTIEQLLEAHENGTNNTFLESVLVEIANTTSMCNSLVVTRTMSLGDYIDLLDSEKSITVTTGDTIGYVDFVQGGGSVLEIKLDRDFEAKVGEFKAVIDGDYGYSINSIYGQFFS